MFSWQVRREILKLSIIRLDDLPPGTCPGWPANEKEKESQRYALLTQVKDTDATNKCDLKVKKIQIEMVKETKKKAERSDQQNKLHWMNQYMPQVPGLKWAVNSESGLSILSQKKKINADQDPALSALHIPVLESTVSEEIQAAREQSYWE